MASLISPLPPPVQAPRSRRLMSRRRIVQVLAGLILTFLIFSLLDSSNSLIHLNKWKSSEPSAAPAWFNELRFRYQVQRTNEKRFIPRLIHQTGALPVDHPVTREAYGENIDSWKNKNTDYTYKYYTDDEIAKFVQDSFPTKIVDTFFALPKPILKADFFRYLVLFAKGGVYTDLDTECLVPINDWRKPSGDDPNFSQQTNFGLIVGLEADAADRHDWHDWYARPLQLVQWTIAAVPGHPALLEVIRRIVESTDDYLATRNDQTAVNELPDGHHINIVEWTGPGVWTDSVLVYLGLLQGSGHGSVARNDNTKDLNQKWSRSVGALSHLRHGRLMGPHANNAAGPRKTTWFSGPQYGLDPIVYNVPSFDDTLVLPITGFSPGVGHMGAGEIDDPEAKVHHKFSGSWKEHQDSA